MPTDVGFATQTPSLPKGGSLGGLGETFTPDLSTGTGTLAVPFDLPNGPNDIGPRLSLRYDTGGSNGPFGLGWSIPLPRISRSTTGGLPRYDDSDTLVLEGSGPLVRTTGGLRPQVETGEWRIAPDTGPSGDGLGFVATDRAGTRFHLGTTAAARIPGPGDVPLSWLLDRIEDNLGEDGDVRLGGRRHTAVPRVRRVRAVRSAAGLRAAARRAALVARGVRARDRPALPRRRAASRVAAGGRAVPRPALDARLHPVRAEPGFAADLRDADRGRRRRYDARRASAAAGVLHRGGCGAPRAATGGRARRTARARWHGRPRRADRLDRQRRGRPGRGRRERSGPRLAQPGWPLGTAVRDRRAPAAQRPHRRRRADRPRRERLRRPGPRRRRGRGLPAPLRRRPRAPGRLGRLSVGRHRVGVGAARRPRRRRRRRPRLEHRDRAAAGPAHRRRRGVGRPP